MTRIITLLTDFGTADGYVGEVKAALASGAPGAMLVDISHDVAAHDVDGARLALARYWRRFPPGTVHLVVVDPGVGGDARGARGGERGSLPRRARQRRALAGAAARRDALRRAAGAAGRRAHLSWPRRVRSRGGGARAGHAGSTRSGRRARPIPIVRRTPEATRRADGAMRGVVIAIDRFGNAVTNLMARRGGVVVVGPHRLPVRRTYADVAPGALVALVGSNGLVEIARRDGSAAAELGLARGSAVSLLSGAPSATRPAARAGRRPAATRGSPAAAGCPPAARAAA